MAITGGFGTTYDLKRGTMRSWIMGRDGVKRWADSNAPCELPAPAFALQPKATRRCPNRPRMRAK